MLSRREYHAWSLTDHEGRKYRSEEERRFFENIRNPPLPTEELKEIVREYGSSLPEKIDLKKLKIQPLDQAWIRRLIAASRRPDFDPGISLGGGGYPLRKSGVLSHRRDRAGAEMLVRVAAIKGQEAEKPHQIRLTGRTSPWN